jgi:hypothetical protein
MRAKITIEVSRTVQINSYEPVSVKVIEQVEVGEDEDANEVRDETYARVTKAVKRYIDNEAAKYGAKAKK